MSAGVGGTDPSRIPLAQLQIRLVPPGAVLELVDGQLARVTDNSGDGIWLVCDVFDDLAADAVETRLVMFNEIECQLVGEP